MEEGLEEEGRRTVDAGRRMCSAFDPRLSLSVYSDYLLRTPALSSVGHGQWREASEEAAGRETIRSLGPATARHSWMSWARRRRADDDAPAPEVAEPSSSFNLL